MKKQCDKNRIKHIVKAVLAVCLLVALTLLAMEVPGIYYKTKDHDLSKQVATSEYRVGSNTKTMDEDMLIDSFYSSDTMYVDTKTEYSDAEITRYLDEEISRIRSCVIEEWSDYLYDSTKRVLDKKMKCIRVVRTIDDCLYIADLGIICFYNGYTMGSPAILVFDMNTGKIAHFEYYKNYDRLDEDTLNDYYSQEYYDNYFSLEADATQLIGVICVDGSVTSLDAFLNWDKEQKWGCTYVSAGYDYLSITPFYVSNPEFETYSDEYGGTSEYMDYDYNQNYNDLQNYISQQVRELMGYMY